MREIKHGNNSKVFGHDGCVWAARQFDWLVEALGLGICRMPDFELYSVCYLAKAWQFKTLMAFDILETI